jgi:hypothetical protein
MLDLDYMKKDTNEKSFYQSEEELLNDILEHKKVKHYRQLRHLATKHEGSILKLRFVLNPFSFVFLLRGGKQFHILLETLDTEEATYIWHTRLTIQEVRENKQLIYDCLQKVDQDLNEIRNKGRHIFLESSPENFSKIQHDYSDDRKGFVIWKDMVEERLL